MEVALNASWQGFNALLFKKMANQGSKDPEKASREVGRTVGVFNTRMQRKLKERELQDQVANRAAEQRHQRMLQALTVIRKALTEAAKMSFNDRFALALRTSDWEGWPRIDLVLVDSLAPNDSHNSLTVTAHDRNRSGTVQLVTKGGECLTRLFMGEEDALGKLPLALKSSIRRFLDQLSNYVLNPPDPDQILEVQAKNISPGDENVAVDTKLSKEEFFTEDAYAGDDLVTDVDIVPIDGNND